MGYYLFMGRACPSVWRMGLLSRKILDTASLDYWEKWVHQLNRISAITYVVDINSYLQSQRQADGDSATLTEMEESLGLFENMINSPILYFPSSMISPGIRRINYDVMKSVLQLQTTQIVFAIKITLH